MATPGRLSNPPIKEALVDLRVVLNTAAEERAFEPLHGELVDRYPIFEWRHRLETRVDAGPGKVPLAQARDAGFHGLLMKDAAESRIAQFRPDGFTLSHVGQYTSGDDLFMESLALWDPYRRVVKPRATIRIALRYINRLLLPLKDGEDFSRFMTAAVTMPEGTPQRVSEFLSRAVVPHENSHDTAAIVTQRLEPGVEKATPFVLDIDVFKIGDFATEASEIQPYLEALRNFKNDLFFSFLTDDALEPYR